MRRNHRQGPSSEKHWQGVRAHEYDREAAMRLLPGLLEALGNKCKVARALGINVASLRQYFRGRAYPSQIVADRIFDLYRSIWDERESF